MSYSIGVTRSTKAELEIAISQELSKIPETQLIHKADIDQAFNAAKSLINRMTDVPGRDLRCSVAGSIYNPGDAIEHVSINVNVQLQPPQK